MSLVVVGDPALGYGRLVSGGHGFQQIVHSGGLDHRDVRCHGDAVNAARGRTGSSVGLQLFAYRAVGAVTVSLTSIRAMGSRRAATDASMKASRSVEASRSVSEPDRLPRSVPRLALPRQLPFQGSNPFVCRSKSAFHAARSPTSIRTPHPARGSQQIPAPSASSLRGPNHRGHATLTRTPAPPSAD
jgi:hypothetical protein